MNLEMKRSARKRRFNDEQIKSLEIMFGAESKPEPRTKQQLASELGLHPRQVAIWFQNRRARLKSKQIEREYSILKASYDSLASKLESLKKDNQALIAQVQSLKSQLDKAEGSISLPSKQSLTEADDYLHESNAKPAATENNTFLVDTRIGNPDWLKEEDDDILNLAEPVDSSLTSSENSWDSSCFLDQPCSSSLLWEFWS